MQHYVLEQHTLYTMVIMKIRVIATAEVTADEDGVLTVESGLDDPR